MDYTKLDDLVTTSSEMSFVTFSQRFIEHVCRVTSIIYFVPSLFCNDSGVKPFFRLIFKLNYVP